MEVIYNSSVFSRLVRVSQDITYKSFSIPQAIKLITETHADHIRDVLSRYDRIIIQGTLPPFCYVEGMTSFLRKHKMRIFDYKQQFAQPLRDAITRHAEQIAHANGLITEYIKKRTFGRKTVLLTS